MDPYALQLSTQTMVLLGLEPTEPSAPNSPFAQIREEELITLPSFRRPVAADLFQ